MMICLLALTVLTALLALSFYVYAPALLAPQPGERLSGRRGRLYSWLRRHRLIPATRGVYCYGRKETARRLRQLARGIIHTS